MTVEIAAQAQPELTAAATAHAVASVLRHGVVAPAPCDTCRAHRVTDLASHLAAVTVHAYGCPGLLDIDAHRRSVEESTDSAVVPLEAVDARR
jgi:hypothetical protein